MRDYCDAQAGFWLNSKFWSKFSSLPLSGIEDQNTPPPFRKTSDLGWPKFTLEYPPFGKVQIWDDQSLLQNTPPSEKFRFGMTKVYSGIPPPFRKTSDLEWPKFTPEIPPSPLRKKFRFGMTKVYSTIPPLRKSSDLG